MERKFYTEDFESLLKDNTDHFKLSPSKKVWHGIYNDLHPGRRWPSIAMSFLFVFTLVIVGHLNTQQSQRNILTENQKRNKIQSYVKDNTNLSSQNIRQTKISSENIDLAPKFSFYKQKSQVGVKFKADKKLPGKSSENSILDTKSKPDRIAIRIEQKNWRSSDKENNVSNTNDNINELADLPKHSLAIISGYAAIISTFPNIDTKDNLLSGDYNLLINNSSNIKYDELAKSQDSDSKNKSAIVPIVKRHRNPKVSWSYYTNPTLSYRSYSKQNDVSEILASSSYITPADLNRPIIYHPSIGVEAGTAMKYSLLKNLRFTLGFQVNYSAYSVQANNVHPIIANLLLHDDNTKSFYSVSSISNYGNGPGTVPLNLHNYSLQISVPIGLEYRLAGNDKVQLNVAAGFQPSFVVANRAYLLSSDRKNYLTQPSLSRPWNIGSSIGTFVSFNSNKFNWQIGPQMQYQLFSSYRNNYQVREHWMNYGIRFGVSKVIK